MLALEFRHASSLAMYNNALPKKKHLEAAKALLTKLYFLFTCRNRRNWFMWLPMTFSLVRFVIIYLRVLNQRICCTVFVRLLYLFLKLLSSNLVSINVILWAVHLITHCTILHICFPPLLKNEFDMSFNLISCVFILFFQLKII